jgi:hypothetical protein
VSKIPKITLVPKDTVKKENNQSSKIMKRSSGLSTITLALTTTKSTSHKLTNLKQKSDL